MTSPAKLAERAEAATEGEQREVLEAAWLLIHHGGYAPENERDTCRKCDRFTRLLDAEAYLDAAVMLVPEGMTWSVDEGPAHWILTGEDKPKGRAEVTRLRADYADNPGLCSTATEHSFAATPALAIVAAILRANPEQDHA